MEKSGELMKTMMLDHSRGQFNTIVKDPLPHFLLFTQAVTMIGYL